MKGINGQSILFELSSTKFLKSFPIDIMHLLYENIPQYMFKHWSGTFYKSKENPIDEYFISKNVWSEIGKRMQESRKMMPTHFGRPPRNIHTHHNGFKAEEWANWIILYSLPLLKNHLSPKVLNGWRLFVDLVRLCQKRIISNEDINEIQNLASTFYKYYER